MLRIFKIATLAMIFAVVSCETSEDLSSAMDHEVPECTSLTLSSNSETIVIDDGVLPLLMWGLVPEVNMETIVLPTLTVGKGSIVNLSVVLSDNVGVKTAELAYSNWLFAKYINFANPEGDIPLTPKSYTFTAQIEVPQNAVVTPWLEDYYFNDGSSMKVTQSYHKLTLTIVDVNMNERIVPIFIKVE